MFQLEFETKAVRMQAPGGTYLFSNKNGRIFKLNPLDIEIHTCAY